MRSRLLRTIGRRCLDERIVAFSPFPFCFSISLFPMFCFENDDGSGRRCLVGLGLPTSGMGHYLLFSFFACNA